MSISKVSFQLVIILVALCIDNIFNGRSSVIAKKQSNGLTETLYSTKITVFQGKHFFIVGGTNHDKNGNIFNSYAELTRDPLAARKYLIDLNLKLVKGNILPQDGGDQFDKWFQNGRVINTVVDADFKTLTQDVKEDFKMWRNEQSKDGILSYNSVEDLKRQVFETKNSYLVTQLSFHENERDSSDKILNGVIRAKQMKAAVDLGVDKYGLPNHLVGISPAQTIAESVIANFTRDELAIIVKEAKIFWKAIGVKAKDENLFLNENYPAYQTNKPLHDANIEQETAKSLKESSNADSTGENEGGICHPPVSTGLTCAILLKSNGDIDSIHPKEFIQAYKSADPKEKMKMAQLVKKNKNKIFVGDSEDIRKMMKLAKLEEMKAHVAAADIVNLVENFGHPKRRKENAAEFSTTDYLENLEEQMENVQGKVKISSSKVAHSIASSKSDRQVDNRLGHVSIPIGGYFLGKTLINGIVHNDTTSLAIVGGRVGMEMITGGTATSVGPKYLEQAGKWGKFTTKLGKWVDPVVAVVDIGLSVWSMTKSIERLNNAKNAYDRDDAIADIVGDAIDIATTASVTTVSFFFPPLKPAAIAIGLVVNIISKVAIGAFKAWNEVRRIDAEIPLLGFEKGRIFRSRFFDWFGTRQPDYMDHLLAEKKLNDLAVQRNLHFLENNLEFLGIVFPSRSLHYEGACKLTKRHCYLANVGGCTTWSGDRGTLVYGCDHGKPCGPSQRICTDFWEWKKPGYWGYDDYKCDCGSATTEFGQPRPNSVVDFRRKQTVYWERAVPNDVSNAEFQCKPGNLYFVDYKVSEVNDREEYLCENAIGLLQPWYRREPGQNMLFDLDNGDDQVYLGGGATYSSIFRMGEDGYKEFYGGGVKNEFLFDSKCEQNLRGTFSGGSQFNDGIIIGNTCAEGKDILVDFKTGNLKSAGGNLELRFSSIEEFSGREGQPDIVEVACSTRRVIGRGGISTTKPDQVNIADDPTCNFNLTLFGAPYTNITSMASKGDISIAIGATWTGLNIELQDAPLDHLRQKILFLENSANNVTGWTLNKNENCSLVTIEALNDTIQFTFKITPGQNEFEISSLFYFIEEPNSSPYSRLLIPDEQNGTAIFYHSLPNLIGNPQRVGCSNIGNIFEISGPWNITGGDMQDEFIMNTENIGTINGGDGVDTLKMHQDFKGLAEIDLNTNITSVEIVQGIPGVPMTVRTSCDTLYVATQGGSVTEADIVTVPGGSCSQRDATIFVVGHTEVVMEGGKDTATRDDLVRVRVDGLDQRELQFKLETRSTEVENLVVNLNLQHRNWTVYTAYTTEDLEYVEVQLKGVNETGRVDGITLKLKQDLRSISGQYLASPFIHVTVINASVEIPGIMVFESGSNQPKMIYQIGNVSENFTTRTARGLLGLENVFRLTADDGDWKAIGGNLSDVFLVTTSENHGGRYYINGGDDGLNTLAIEDGEGEIKSIFQVNLIRSEFGYLKTPTGSRGRISGIHHIFGRPQAADIIHPTCDTQMINGRGGKGEWEGLDIILIGVQKCSYQLAIKIGIFSIIRNWATKGTFMYVVEDLDTTSVEYQPKKETTHHFKFLFHPWEFLSSIAFNQSTETMGWKVLDGQHKKIHVFPMWKPSTAKEYTNPVFDFHPSGSTVSSDIRVGADGVTMATFFIQGTTNAPEIRGLPVDLNRFLVNITTSLSSHPSGKIHGCSDGSRCSANQFWIFSLNSSLELLDGGSCGNATCTNYLHFSEDFQYRELFVDMDISTGSVRTNEGDVAISQLKNMHELHGTRGITASATCDTRQVSNVDKIFIEDGNCPLNLIIGLEEHTAVWFQDPLEYYINKDVGTDDDFNSTVHYRFSVPMSFEVEGSIPAMTRHNHNFYLPFNLMSLSSLRFDIEEDRLYYGLSENVYYLSMITAPSYNEQFYPQPNMVTEDGYKIQISRAGAIWATLGNTSSEEITSDSIPDLQVTANTLSVTIVAHTPTEFFFVGYSSNVEDRNMIQNIATATSHLCGGGADNTIYEIVSLNKDVYIYTGFNENKMSENGKEQTIDLTDIVVPIRSQSGTKYVPSITSEAKNLIISMTGYQNTFPGRVILVNGAFPWMARRVQLLLNSAKMDLVSNLNKDNDSNVSSPKKQKRSVEPYEDAEWIIVPQPVTIPDDISIFSISPEDLEDDQSIVLEKATTSSGSTNDSDATFNLLRNGTSLYLTNIQSFDMDNIRTVVINDFYKPPGVNGSDKNDLKITIPSSIIGLTINLPGISLTINETTIINLTNDGSAEQNVPLVSEDIPQWSYVLHDTENKLLADIPEIPRMFWCEDCLPWWKQSKTHWIAGVTLVICIMLPLIFLSLRFLNRYRRNWRANQSNPTSGKDDREPVSEKRNDFAEEAVKFVTIRMTEIRKYQVGAETPLVEEY